MLNQGGKNRSTTCGKLAKSVLTSALFHPSCTLAFQAIPTMTGNKTETQITIPSVTKAQFEVSLLYQLCSAYTQPAWSREPAPAN